MMNAASDQVVATTSGRVRGRATGNMIEFIGIPYAAAPVGRHRFRLPVASRPWVGVLEADRPGPAAPQLGSPAVVDEDCLRLHISTPAADGARRPVVVWVHGGGFTSGFAEAPHTSTRRMVEAADVVSVRVSYRLGALGWLYLGGHDADLADTGNLGMSDVLAALRWIERNIEGFGGDPDRVTLQGQSAGAFIAAALVAAPSAEGSFHRAVLQSGAADHALSTNEASDIADRFLVAAGARRASDLLTIPVVDLLAAQEATVASVAGDWARRPRADRFLVFSPVAATPLLPQQPLDALRSGVGSTIALVVGANRDESRVFPGDRNDESAVRTWLGQIGASDPDAIWHSYRRRCGADAQVVHSAMRSDLYFRLPGERLARSRRNARNHTWHYDFRWPSSVAGLGAAHGIEVRVVLNLLDDPEALVTHAATPRSLATAMQGAWAALARDADPNAVGLPLWPAFGEQRTSMLFDELTRPDDGIMDDLVALWGDGPPA